MSGKKRKNNTPKKPNQTSGEAIVNDPSAEMEAALGNDEHTPIDSSTDDIISDAETSLDTILDGEPLSDEPVDELDVNTNDAEPVEVSEADHNISEASPGVSIEKAATEAASDVETGATASESSSTTSSVEAPLSAPAEPSPQSSGMVKKLGLLFLLLLIILLALGGYFGWQYWQQLQVGRDSQSQAVEAVDSKLSQQLTAQQKTIEALSAQVLSRESSVDDMRLLVEQTVGEQDWVKQRLENHTNRLRSLAGTSREDWILAEARYLLRLANQRLLTERGTRSAQSLLQTVDKMLLDLDGADLFSVRQAIQNDIAALRLAPNVDREGIYLRIGALAKQVRTVPSAPISQEGLSERAAPKAASQVEQASEAETEEETSSWYSPVVGSFSKAWSAVANSVEVRHYDSPPSLFITEQEEASVRHNLHLLLTQAQLSLLREEPEIYKASLTNAIEWVNQYFGHYDKKSVLVEELASLHAMPVAEQLPDISASLKVLTDYIERYHKLTPDKKSATEAEKETEAINDVDQEASK